MRGIEKSFPGVRALDGVDLEVRAGEVHALVGENGAGKSTLMKILAGALPADGGSIEIDGAPVRIAGPRSAESFGIGMIYQEFNLVPDLGVVENVVLGHEPLRRGLLDARAARARTIAVLEELGIALPLDRPARRLAVAEQQLLEIAKTFARKARLIVMDEPTAALSERETERLFGLISQLRARGVAFVYISHRLEELPRIADRITVIRDGKTVATAPAGELDAREVVRLMVGRALDAHFPALPEVAPAAPLVLAVRELSSGERVR
ncbi:MAG: ATP-binding cassette domain-containing protein, partial [Vulcanimicrobiaceae bacterium]